MVKQFDIKKFLAESKIPLYENQDWTQYFYKQIFPKLRGKRVGIWKLEPEGMMGSVGLHSPAHDETAVYATPYWEGKEGIAVQVYDAAGGQDVHSKTFPFSFSGDPRKDMDNYLKELRMITQSSWFKKTVADVEGRLVRSNKAY